LNYKQALAFLSARGNEVQAIHLGLHRIRAVMRALGDPHRAPATLHVAGTNGKGSVAAMAESILRQAGLRTGLYTSPHLAEVRERIRISGRKVGPARFASLMTDVGRVEARLLARGALDVPLTFFELVTACAFLAFAEAGVEAAVVEVGLGGRLDATNIVRPRVCAITTISYDHQSLLGDSLAEIAREKAGIVKRAVPVVTSCRARPALRVLRARARALGAPLLEIDRSCRTRLRGERDGRYRFDLETPARAYRGLRPALRGEHQVRNAAVAIAAVERFDAACARPAVVRRGLALAAWPGRIDEYRARRRTLVDGAHNPEAVEALRRYLEHRRVAEIHLVFGAMRDKEIGKMGALLFPLARTIHLAPLAGPRAATATEIAARTPRFADRIRLHTSARAALEAAWRACPRRGMVVVTGSLYLAGALLKVVRNETSRA